jgi:hypothetical protein
MVKTRIRCVCKETVFGNICFKNRGISFREKNWVENWYRKYNHWENR